MKLISNLSGGKVVSVTYHVNSFAYQPEKLVCFSLLLHVVRMLIFYFNIELG